MQFPQTIFLRIFREIFINTDSDYECLMGILVLHDQIGLIIGIFLFYNSKNYEPHLYF